ncbi:MAG TPA: hypothetical protein VF832_01985, partial [Longimicrobiales bacterium]
APDSLPRLSADAPASRLLPALQAASEAGVGRAIVVTDGALEDAGDVARWLPRLNLDLDVRPVARAAVPDFGVAEVTAAPWAQSGKPFEIDAAIAAVQPPAESVTVTVRQDGRPLAQRRVPAPPAGRTTPAVLSVTPVAPRGGGLVRYDVAVTASDAVPDDDERTIYVYVSEQPAGVTLVSFHPDWEPRFLQPILQNALGLPTRGFLMVAPGRFLTAGPGTEAGQVASEADVRAAVGQAEVVVLHGLGGDAPAWAQAAARTAPRVMLFPTGQSSDLGLPSPLPLPLPSEWYVSPDVPSSPVAPLLSGINVTEVPPLTALRPLTLPAGAWAPLNATRGRNGAPSPLAMAGQTGARRWVVALGEGYWQWAFRGGNARDIYQRLWASLGGWLIQERRALAGAAIRPVRRVVPRGETVQWTAPGLAAESIAVRVTGETGQMAIDTVMPVLKADTATMRPLPPGQYRFAARAVVAGKVAATAEGPFTVERFSPDFLLPIQPPAALTAESTPLGPGSLHQGRGAPLHTTPWPYILIVLTLVTEWILRRRWGLR